MLKIFFVTVILISDYIACENSACFKFSLVDNDNVTKVDVEHVDGTTVEVTQTNASLCKGGRTLSVTIFKSENGARDIQATNNKLGKTDYEYFPGFGYYKLYSVALNWYTAKKICEAEKSHLVVPRSSAEMKVVIDFLNRGVAFSDTVFRSDAWIGLSDLESEGDFTSVTGESLISVGYVNWYHKEPEGGRSENCVNIYKNGDYYVNSCDVKRAFICKRDIRMY